MSDEKYLATWAELRSWADERTAKTPLSDRFGGCKCESCNAARDAERAALEAECQALPFGLTREGEPTGVL